MSTPRAAPDRLAYRRRYAELPARELSCAVEAGEIPRQDVRFTAAALFGGCGEARRSARDDGGGRQVVSVIGTFVQRAIGAAEA